MVIQLEASDPLCCVTNAVTANGRLGLSGRVKVAPVHWIPRLSRVMGMRCCVARDDGRRSVVNAVTSRNLPLKTVLVDMKNTNILIKNKPDLVNFVDV